MRKALTTNQGFLFMLTCSGFTIPRDGFETY